MFTEENRPLIVFRILPVTEGLIIKVQKKLATCSSILFIKKIAKDACEHALAIRELEAVISVNNAIFNIDALDIGYNYIFITPGTVRVAKNSLINVEEACIKTVCSTLFNEGILKARRLQVRGFKDKCNIFNEQGKLIGVEENTLFGHCCINKEITETENSLKVA